MRWLPQSAKPWHAKNLEERVILTALCGHGHLDLASYEKYLPGEMVDLDLSDAAIAEAMQEVPNIDA